MALNCWMRTCKLLLNIMEGNLQVLCLIENEIQPDLAQRRAMSQALTDSKEMTDEQAEQQETTFVSYCESVSKEVGEQHIEQESFGFSDDFDSQNELDEKHGEAEDMGMSMGM